LGSAFFGLTPKYKLQVYQEVHDLVYYGNGGFIYSEVYQMPIHIRRYHIRKIDVLHKKQNEELQKARESSNTTSSVPKMPNINKR
tara:strand:- start:122 stop:376 length:255 start_codon:yes stop_codon:yes gene_type:complete